MMRGRDVPTPAGALPTGLPAATPTERRPGTSGRIQGRSGSRNSDPTSGDLTHAVARVGRRRLLRVLQSLSRRDLAVLQSVAEHRLLGSRHVEVLHFHDHATALSGALSAARA